MNKHLTTTLENSRNYTLTVAQAMPADQYSSKLIDGAWNFDELLHHIAYGIGWWEANFIKGKKTDWNPPATKENKKAVIAYLEAAYDSLEATMKKEKAAENVINGFHATLDHITHHRGQAVLHLRAHGIVPPDYTY